MSKNEPVINKMLKLILDSHLLFSNDSVKTNSLISLSLQHKNVCNPKYACVIKEINTLKTFYVYILVTSLSPLLRKSFQLLLFPHIGA